MIQTISIMFMTGETYKYEVKSYQIEKREIYKFVQSERDNINEEYEIFMRGNDNAVINSKCLKCSATLVTSDILFLFCLPKIRERKEYEYDNDLEYGSTQFIFAPSHFYAMKVIGQTTKFKKFEYTTYRRVVGGLLHQSTVTFKRKFENHDDYIMISNSQYELFCLNKTFLRDDNQPHGIDHLEYYNDNK